MTEEEEQRLRRFLSEAGVYTNTPPGTFMADIGAALDVVARVRKLDRDYHWLVTGEYIDDIQEYLLDE